MIKHSVIIPTAGRPSAIKAAVQSIQCIDRCQTDFEVIVVDNNSSKAMSNDLRAYCSTLDARVLYVREPSPGLSAARHKGAAEAQGNLLTFIDDDVEVSVGWLKAISNGFSDPDVAMVGGPSIPKFTGSIPSWFWDYLEPTPYGGWMCGWLSLLDIGKDVQSINPNLIWGLNFSIRRQVLEACGGFHVDLVPAQFQRWQGDGETGLTMKAHAAGYRATYLKDAMLLHHCGPDRLNVDYFKRRAYYQGICASFSQIRAGQVPLHNTAPSPEPSLYHRLKSSARRGLTRFQRRSSIWITECAQVKNLTDQAYRDGWLFHQREAASDPDLLKWIRRDNFLNVDLREQLSRERSPLENPT